MPEYATRTPEARESVAELDFQSPLACYNTRNQWGGDALRVLRPLSDEAEEDELGDLDYEHDDFTSSNLQDTQRKRRTKQAFGKMVVEIAALREQMEMTRLAGRG
ncbi:MAG: hypothetical protein Q9164_005292 [Protoblastenia rupestris]